MFIKPDGTRINIYSRFTSENGTRYASLENADVRTQLGITEIPDPIPPADYSDETYYRTEQDDAPYVIYTQKPPEQLTQLADNKAFASAKQHLLDTDYAFTVDKYAQLTEERKGELTTSREAARQVIRDYEAKYPPIGFSVRPFASII